MFKTNEHVKEELDKAYQCLETQQFQKAINAHLKVEKYLKQVKRISPKQKERAQHLQKELFIYLKVNEAYAKLNTTGTTQHIQILLDQIRGLRNEIEYHSVDNKLYIKDYLKFQKKFLVPREAYNHTRDAFEAKIIELIALANSYQAKKAMQKFPDLMLCFSVLQPDLDATEEFEYYHRMRDLYRELSVESLEQQSHIRIKQATSEHKSIPLPKLQYHKERTLDHPRTQSQTSQNHLDNIKQLLKKGNHKQAKQIIENI